MKIYEYLEQAKEIIKLESNWTQNICARDIEGKDADVHSPNATCWCLDGAIMKVTNFEHPNPLRWPEYEKVETFVANSIGRNYATFNDEHTHAEVIAKLDEVIQEAKEQNV